MPTTTAPAPPPIDRRSGLAYSEFARDYLFPLKPVVLSGALNDWPAIGKWNPEFFRSQFRDRQLDVDGPIRCGELIDRIELSNAADPAPYLHAQRIENTFPELIPDVEPWPVYLGPNWLKRSIWPAGLRERSRGHASTEIFIGGLAARFPYLHFDDYHYHAYVGQIYGLKKFFIFAPDQSPRLYPTPGRTHVSLIGDVERPDLDKFPLAAEARGQTCVLEPGDLLFLPSGWWHTTRMLNTSISVATNVVNASNWQQFAADVADEMSAHHSRWKMGLYLGYLKWYGARQAFKDRRTNEPRGQESESVGRG